MLLSCFALCLGTRGGGREWLNVSGQWRRASEKEKGCLVVAGLSLLVQSKREAKEGAPGKKGGG